MSFRSTSVWLPELCTQIQGRRSLVVCPGLPEASLPGMCCHVRSRFSPIARSSAHRAKAPHRNRSPDDVDVDEGGTPETNKQRSLSSDCETSHRPGHCWPCWHFNLRLALGRWVRSSPTFTCPRSRGLREAILFHRATLVARQLPSQY